MIRKRIGLIVGAVILGAATSSAVAQQLDCAHRDRVAHHLSNTDTEKTIAIGLTDRGGMLELSQSNDGKTWTIVTTPPDGVCCQLAGRSYAVFPPQGAPYRLSQ